tara:strand:- start:25982 stop:26134 length:153 start_codon:yes stop_codon:yes gene_type:complete
MHREDVLDILREELEIAVRLDSDGGLEVALQLGGQTIARDFIRLEELGDV